MSAAAGPLSFMHIPGKIFYTNGMTTHLQEAEKHCDELRKITAADVELHHNHTTPADKVNEMLLKTAIGVVGLTYALTSEKKTSEKKAVDTVVGVGSGGLLVWALKDFADIQHEKNESAAALSKKVTAYLDKHPLYHVTLVFHSQGADIGYRALQQLAHLKNRIHVVTIGGMVNIPDSFASRVVNFQNDGDFISKLAQTAFDLDPGKKTRVKTSSHSKGLVAPHVTTDYLVNPIIRDTLRSLSQPKTYQFR